MQNRLDLLTWPIYLNQSDSENQLDLENQLNSENRLNLENQIYLENAVDSENALNLDNTLDSENGLDSVNGLNTVNGLDSVNGLDLENGLNSDDGLNSDNGRINLTWKIDFNGGIDLTRLRESTLQPESRQTRWETSRQDATMWDEKLPGKIRSIYVGIGMKSGATAMKSVMPSWKKFLPLIYHALHSRVLQLFATLQKQKVVAQQPIIAPDIYD